MMALTKFVTIRAVRVVQRGWLDKPFVLEAQFSNMDDTMWNQVNAFETETVARNAAQALIRGDKSIAIFKPEEEPATPAGDPAHA